MARIDSLVMSNISSLYRESTNTTWKKTIFPHFESDRRKQMSADQKPAIPSFSIDWMRLSNAIIQSV
ncbi:MAG: hypothetical protein ABJC87_18455, partial [Roseobacter sp.]